jgi:hypothetical protein
MQPYLYGDAMHNFEQLLFLVDAGKLEAGL